MSCFIMHPKALATLADTMQIILYGGYSSVGFDPPKSLHNALPDCRDRYGYYFSEKIFRRLYNLNAAAYAGRYRTTQEEAPDMPEVSRLAQLRDYAEGHDVLKPWHYQFAKLLDCLIYQCYEDATENDPLFLALLDLSKVFNAYLVCNNDLYYASKWGEI